MNMESKLLTDTQIRIQDQAKSLFMKFGFRSVSMDDIANALGISKKTIYLYFTDKDELVQAIVKQDICETENEWANCLAIAENAIDEICTAYSSGALKDEDKFHNLKWMQKTTLAKETA